MAVATAEKKRVAESSQDPGNAPRILVLPFGFAVALLAFALIPEVQRTPSLLWSVLTSGAILIAWTAALFAIARRRRPTLTMNVVLLKQHYLQACAQGSVLLYWGWYWREVYSWAYLIAAQLIFAYAFDMLLKWSRHDDYTLGFGPFPVIFSINLFLWFKPEWFYLQLVLVALGFLAKELIHWQRDGRSVHIFNPSSFPLAVFSLALILTGTTDMTHGQDIAITQFYPPHMFLMLFLVALPGQFFFGVTSMTMSAVVTTYLFGLLYHAVTGIYFFYDLYVPIAVFLGMHLLFTDPSTSPRTELGRLIFGMLYGLSTVALYEVLRRLGVPTFYDKLLQVPLLNLSVRFIDRAARSRPLRALDPAAIGRWLAPRQRNLAYISIWTVVFATMSAVGGVGDNHPGQWVTFWQSACRNGRPYACPYLVNLLTSDCNRGSGWACNELATMQMTLALSRKEPIRSDLVNVFETVKRGCDRGFVPACQNLAGIRAGTGTVEGAPPALQDYPILLRGTKGPLINQTPSELYARACEQGWPDTCERTGSANGP